jgi:hypothetical protein
MNKEDARDIVDQGHPPDVERLLLELELNLNFLKFLEQRKNSQKKVSECCGAELYDQAGNNYGGGYAPNEVCSHCEKREKEKKKRD